MGDDDERSATGLQAIGEALHHRLASFRIEQEVVGIAQKDTGHMVRHQVARTLRQRQHAGRIAVQPVVDVALSRGDLVSVGLLRFRSRPRGDVADMRSFAAQPLDLVVDVRYWHDCRRLHAQREAMKPLLLFLDRG